MSEWHIITCEYPPQTGGVSDYTELVAHGLAEAGAEVHVWAPSEAQRAKGQGQSAKGKEQKAEGGKQNAECSGQKAEVTIHRELGTFRPSDLRRVGKQLDRFPKPRRILVQWVPHGYGYRSMNLPFCFWLWRRAKFRGDRIELMVHEPFLAFGEGSRKQDVAAAVHRLMIVLLLNAASQIWISTQSWEKHLRRFLFGSKKPIGWLPVPNNIPVVDDPIGIAKARAEYASNGTRLIGHFGAYNDYMKEAMSELLPLLLNAGNDLTILLLGKGSSELRDCLVQVHPQLSTKVHATGELRPDEISKHISACDIMLQPYQDGVSGRRTSVMTVLEHGVPLVTTRGKATESCWIENESVKLSECGNSDFTVQAVSSFLSNPPNDRIGEAGPLLYDRMFSLKQTIKWLTAKH